MATTAATMGQIATSSAGSPDRKRFGGKNTTGSISGGNPTMGDRRGGAKAYAQQEAFQPTTDITGAMQQSDKIMFEPVQIPGMMPNMGLHNAFTGQGAFSGNRLDAMIPMPMTTRKAIARSPFSHRFSDVFVPTGDDEETVEITIEEPTCETHPSMPRCRDDDDEPEDDDVVEPEGGRYTSEEEKAEDEKAHPYGGDGGRISGAKGKSGKAPTHGGHHPGVTKSRTTRAPASGPHGGGMTSSESAESAGYGTDPMGEFGPGTSASGDGEGSKVICGELHRQGLMSDEVYQGDLDYQDKYVDENTKHGYLLWARPVSRLMRRSRIMTQIAKPFATAWAEEMAYRANGIGSGNVFGAIILATIAPICTLIGKIAGPRSKKALLPA